MAQTTMGTLQNAGQVLVPPTAAFNMDSVEGFSAMQKAARLFADSTIVPSQFRGNLPNCFIALEIAIRMGLDVFMVMQNLYIVNGNPAWSAQFLIAAANVSGRFTPFKYVFQGRPDTPEWGCRVITSMTKTGEKIEGPLVTMKIANESGWVEKNGSKWKSMPEQMLRYRAASWFIRAHAPEIAMGLRTIDEEQERVIEVEATDVTDGATATMTMEDLKPEAAGAAPPQTPHAETVNPETGEVTEAAKASADAPATESAPAAPKKGAKRAAPPELPVNNSYMVSCPRRGDSPVDERDECLRCPERNGCPALE